MPSEIRSSGDPLPTPGPFLAKVVSHLDPNFMGGLEVEILQLVGSDGSEGTLHQVKYMSPFAGQTSVDYITETNDYNNTQKSYGMWMVAPDVGSTVIVIFIDGDPRKGYWIGCVPDEHQNFMVPGIAATKFSVENQALRVPVAEYNKRSNEAAQPDATKIKKPEHPFTKVLLDQGLLLDDIRGITTSSARREVPSMVFGISTPGPLDKQTDAKTGKVGKKEHQISGAFVSRLGGTTFVMDDGDDKFLRRTPAGEGPPNYASTGDGETDGDPTIPHNELVRIRTRTGHQILLHNSEDLIYIGNAKGTTWIELTSNGKIDIYAKDSISVHSENDINFTADRDINLTAGRNVNINATTNFNVYAGTNYEIKAGADGKLTVGGQSNIKAGGNHVETARQIHMNGPAADPADTAPKAQRIPLKEPWAGHDNLDPLSHTPDLTEAVLEPTLIEPEYFEQYTTVTDPFEKIKPPDTEQ
jgi:hypothetical protein